MTRAASTCPRCGAHARHGTRFCGTCGTSLSAVPAQRTDDGDLDLGTPRPAGLPAPAPPPPPERTGAVAAGMLRSVGAAVLRGVRRVPVRVRLITAGVTAAVLLVTCGAYTLVQRQFYGPDRPVTEVFAALAARDGARLARAAGCGANPLCRPGALATGYRPPDGLEILGVTYGAALPEDRAGRADGDSAVVAVRYRLAGATYTDRVGVRRGSGLLFRSWTVRVLPGAPLDVTAPHLTAVRVAAADVRIVAGADLTRAVPGGYTVTGPAGPLFAEASTTVTVAGAGAVRTAALPATLQPAVPAEVTRQVRARIDACAASPDFRPRVESGRCPFEYRTAFTFLKDQRWTVLTYPEVAATVGGDGTVTVRTTAPGQMKISYAWSTDVLEPKRWNIAEDTVPIADLGGTVTANGATVVWSD